MSRRRILLAVEDLDDSFPIPPGTIYNYSSRGCSWLSRIGPNGRRGRHLWIDIEAYNEWSRLERRSHRLDVNHPDAVVVEEEVGAH